MRNISFISSLLLSLFMLSSCVKVISPQRSKTPAVVQVVTESPHCVRVIVWSDDCFSSEDNYLSSVCYQQLPKLVEVLTRYTEEEAPIKIVGYQDDILGTHAGEEVADQQASVIARYLWQHGFSVKRFIIQGVGGQDFLSSNRNIGSSQANRRVEITVGQAK